MVQQKGLPDDVTGVAEEIDFAAARAAARYKHSMSERTFIQLSGEFLQDLSDGEGSILNTEAAWVAPLSRMVALKVSYLIRRDNHPDFESTDRTLSTAIQVSY